MSLPLAEPPEQTSAAANHEAPQPQLLMDQLLRPYDLAVIHAQVFRAPPAVC